jgi:hypothetical protein
MINSEFTVVHNVVPDRLIKQAVWEINRELFINGITTEEIKQWHNTGCWFPHLTLRKPFCDIVNLIPELFKTDIPCGPQIVVVGPDSYKDADNQWFHTDDTPDWAIRRGLTLYSIVGVALTPATVETGTLKIIKSSGEIVSPEIQPGDIIVLHPRTEHSRGLNFSPYPRYTFYYRWLITNEENKQNI